MRSGDGSPTPLGARIASVGEFLEREQTPENYWTGSGDGNEGVNNRPYQYRFQRLFSLTTNLSKCVCSSSSQNGTGH